MIQGGLRREGRRHATRPVVAHFRDLDQPLGEHCDDGMPPWPNVVGIERTTKKTAVIREGRRHAEAVAAADAPAAGRVPYPGRAYELNDPLELHRIAKLLRSRGLSGPRFASSISSPANARVRGAGKAPPACKRNGASQAPRTAFSTPFLRSPPAGPLQALPDGLKADNEPQTGLSAGRAECRRRPSRTGSEKPIRRGPPALPVKLPVDTDPRDEER
jgi:hypothetical protein